MADLTVTTRWQLEQVERAILQLAQEVDYEVHYHTENLNDSKAQLASQALAMAAIQITGARALLEAGNG